VVEKDLHNPCYKSRFLFPLTRQQQLNTILHRHPYGHRYLLPLSWVTPSHSIGTLHTTNPICLGNNGVRLVASHYEGCCVELYIIKSYSTPLPFSNWDDALLSNQTWPKSTISFIETFLISNESVAIGLHCPLDPLPVHHPLRIRYTLARRNAAYAATIDATTMTLLPPSRRHISYFQKTQAKNRGPSLGSKL